MRSDLIYIPDSELDALIQQDTPYLDLTTLGLDIGDEPASCSSPQRAASVTCTVRGRSVSPCFPTVPALPPKPETCSIGYRKFPLPFL